MTEERTELWIVDRVEGATTVLVGDEVDVVVEVARDLLRELAVEGAVLRVPLGAVGEPEWERATREREEEARRLEEGAERLDRLRSRDPGGDVSL